MLECNNCNYRIAVTIFYKPCPHCGTGKMMHLIQLYPPVADGNEPFKDIPFEQRDLLNVKTSQYDGFRIHIYGGEGKIKHVHVVHKDWKEDACIEIENPFYFLHPGHNKKLNSQLKKRFCIVMERDWNKVKEIWNKNNPENQIDSNAIMPDYNNLQ